MNKLQVKELLRDNVDIILNTMHEELLIADDKGVVIKVNPTFERVYGLSMEEAIGSTVFQLEEAGYFAPSIVAMVLRKKTEITMPQKTRKGEDILVTATPIFDDKKNIIFVVSYSRDITEITRLQARFCQLNNKVAEYEKEIRRLRKDATKEKRILCESLEMQKIMTTINQVADFDVSILLLGDSGVGKTMLAKEIHKRSRRCCGPFIDINCAAIPDTLLESELFGYEEGAFTGAGKGGKKGLVELAEGGTLLLDEISEIPLTLQAKLLKTIQDKEIVRVGGVKTIAVDFRLLAATNRDIEKMTEEGKFRQDLFYRLNVVSLNIPPLKDRQKDIVPLSQLFLREFNDKYNQEKEFHPKVLDIFMEYDWPGNVRQLANAIERVAVTTEENVITSQMLPASLLLGGKPKRTVEGDLNVALKAFEGEIIREAYAKHKSSTEVAKALNISQPTAYRKIKEYIEEGNIRK
ncbi:MAG: sigma-54 interaction domain-containing protein [Lentihominibacter sp.]|jgi:PAS domain S-box-containing protein